MKMLTKIKTGFGVMTAVVLLAGNASAIQYTDNDVIGSIAAGATINGSFIISNPGDGSGTVGFDAALMDLSSALVDFSFFRQPSVGSMVTITIGGLSFTGSSITSGVYTHLGGALLATALDDLRADGVVNYSVKNNSATSILLSGAVLTAQAEYKAVPDGGSVIWLMGIGLIAIGYFGRAFGMMVGRV